MSSVRLFACLMAAAVFLTGGAYYLLALSPSGQRDQCLDLGGCWDKRAKLCRKNKLHAQALCHGETAEAPGGIEEAVR